WRPVLAFGQSRLRQLQGDPSGALELLLPALDLARPRRHWCYPLVALTQISLLVELGRIDEALELGAKYVEIAEREELTSANSGIHVEYSLALLRAGRAEQALAMIERAFALQRPGGSGVGNGAICEARARIAIALKDTEGFERYAERCAEEYG